MTQNHHPLCRAIKIPDVSRIEVARSSLCPPANAWLTLRFAATLVMAVPSADLVADRKHIGKAMDAIIEPINVDGMSWSLKFPGGGEQQPWDWLHFDLVHAQAKAIITQDNLLPGFARHLVTHADESPRIVTDGSAVAGVIPAYARIGDVEEHEVVCWHFAMVPGRLITGRRRPNRTLAKIYEGAKQSRPSCPAALIDTCIAEFAREVRIRLSTLDDELDVIEDALIADRGESGLPDLGGRLGLVRREATRLRRTLAPLARALHEEFDEFPEWAKPDGHDTAERGLHDALDDIVALHDRSRSLQDELTTS